MDTASRSKSVPQEGLLVSFQKAITTRSILIAVALFVANTVVSGAIQYLLNEIFRLLKVQSESISIYASWFFTIFFGFTGYAVFLIIQSRNNTDKTLQSITQIAQQNGSVISELRNDYAEISKNLYIKLGSVEYVDDLYSPDTAIPYKGKVYHVLKDIIKDTSRNIFSLSIGAMVDKGYFIRDDILKTSDEAMEARDQYFTCIESNLSKYHNDPKYEMKYTRIFQVPEDADMKNIGEMLGPRMVKHCKKVLDIENASRRARQGGAEAGKVTVDIKIIRTQRLTGFLLTDDNTVVVFTGGVIRHTDPENNGALILRPYHAGALVFKNKENVYKDFLRRFEVFEYDSEDIKPILKNLP